MPFDPVRVRLPDGQEFGPVSWLEVVQWSEQGRIPLDTTIIDHVSGERLLASTFAIFVRNAAPQGAPDASVSPSPSPPAGTASVNTREREHTVMDYMEFFQTCIGPVIRELLEAQGFRLTEKGYLDVIVSLGHLIHTQLIKHEKFAEIEQRINDDTKRQSAIDFIVNALRAKQADTYSVVIQRATTAAEILQVPAKDAVIASVPQPDQESSPSLATAEIHMASDRAPSPQGDTHTTAISATIAQSIAPQDAPGVSVPSSKTMRLGQRSSNTETIPGFIYQISLTAALKNGWHAFSKKKSVVTVSYILFVIIAMITVKICEGMALNMEDIDNPLVAYYIFVTIAFVLIIGPLTGGLTIQAMNLIRNRKTRISDLFAGFLTYPKWFGASLLYGVVVNFIPALAATVSGDGVIGVMILTVPVVVIFCMANLRWIFVVEAVAEGYGGVAAFKRSAEVTKGREFLCFSICVVLGLLAISGACTYAMGMLIAVGMSSGRVQFSADNVIAVVSVLSTLFTTPLAICCRTALYIAACRECPGVNSPVRRSRPAPESSPPPSPPASPNPQLAHDHQATGTQPAPVAASDALPAVDTLAPVPTTEPESFWPSLSSMLDSMFYGRDLDIYQKRFIGGVVFILIFGGGGTIGLISLGIVKLVKLLGFFLLCFAVFYVGYAIWQAQESVHYNKRLISNALFGPMMLLLSVAMVLMVIFIPGGGPTVKFFFGFLALISFLHAIASCRMAIRMWNMTPKEWEGMENKGALDDAIDKVVGIFFK